MEEIKVGEYIRTKTDGICKLIDKEKDADGKWAGYVNKPFFLREDNILKHSSNITDLIELGDVLEIEEDGIIGCIGWNKETTTLSYKDMIEDIKKGEVKLLGIVTHEQFNSIKYEVKE